MNFFKGNLDLRIGNFGDALMGFKFCEKLIRRKRVNFTMYKTVTSNLFI